MMRIAVLIHTSAVIFVNHSESSPPHGTIEGR